MESILKLFAKKPKIVMLNLVEVLLLKEEELQIKDQISKQQIKSHQTQKLKLKASHHYKCKLKTY